MESKELQAEWRRISDLYLIAFCKRHGYDTHDAFWVGDDAGGTACICDDLFVGIDIMRYDVDNAVPVDEFLSWYEYDTDVATLQTEYDEITGRGELTRINYPSWCKGAPKPYSREDILRMKDAVRELNATKRRFVAEIEKTTSK